MQVLVDRLPERACTRVTEDHIGVQAYRVDLPNRQPGILRRVDRRRELERERDAATRRGVEYLPGRVRVARPHVGGQHAPILEVGDVEIRAARPHLQVAQAAPADPGLHPVIVVGSVVRGQARVERRMAVHGHARHRGDLAIPARTQVVLVDCSRPARPKLRVAAGERADEYAARAGHDTVVVGQPIHRAELVEGQRRGYAAFVGVQHRRPGAFPRVD